MTTPRRSDDEIRADLAVLARTQHPMDQPSVVMLLAADVPSLLARANTWARDNETLTDLLETAEASVAQLQAAITKAQDTFAAMHISKYADNPDWWWLNARRVVIALAAASGVAPDKPAPTWDYGKQWLADIAAERERAHAKHGDTSMESSPADDPSGRRYRILVEEVGEVGKEFNDAEHGKRPVDLAAVRKELIQVAAMAGAWADACSRPGVAPDQPNGDKR